MQREHKKSKESRFQKQVNNFAPASALFGTFPPVFNFTFEGGREQTMTNDDNFFSLFTLESGSENPTAGKFCS